MHLSYENKYVKIHITHDKWLESKVKKLCKLAFPRWNYRFFSLFKNTHCYDAFCVNNIYEQLREKSGMIDV